MRHNEIECPFCGQKTSIYRELIDDVYEFKCDKIKDRELTFIMTYEFISDRLPSLSNHEKEKMLNFVLEASQTVFFSSVEINAGRRSAEYKYISYDFLKKNIKLEKKYR